MNFRFGVCTTLGLAVALVGCGGAGSGSTGGNGLVPQEAAFDEELPAWVEELPEGQPPQDNDFTGRAALSLALAFDAGDDATRDRHLNDALTAAEEGMATAPENPQSYAQAGEALLAMGRIEEGSAMLDRAEEIYPRYIAETMFYREMTWVEELNEGVDLLNAGDTDAAIERFERAHVVYKHRPEAMLNLASAYAQVGRTDDAIDLFGQAVDVIQGPWADRTDEEIRDAWMEQLPIVLQNQAQLLFGQERFDEAAEVYADLLAVNPDDLGVMARYAAALTGANRPDEAEAVFEDLLTRPGLTPADYYNVAIGLYQADSFEQAAAAFHQVYQSVPENRDVVYNLAQSYYLAEDWESLLPVSQHLVEVDPLNPNAYTFLAQTLVRLEREQEAMEVLEERENLEYVIQAMELQLAGDDFVVVGEVVNLAAAAGTSFGIRIHFYDQQGGVIGSADATVELPAEGEAVMFQVTAPDDPELFGFGYELL